MYRWYSIQDYNINLCTKNSNVHELLLHHDYYLHTAFDNLNKSYVDDIVAYISGFIVIKIAKIISCDTCKEQLYSNVYHQCIQITSLKKSWDIH